MFVPRKGLWDRLAGSQLAQGPRESESWIEGALLRQIEGIISREEERDCQTRLNRGL
jgi:hypothetical protein